MIRWLVRGVLVLLLAAVVAAAGFRIAASLRERQEAEAVLPEGGRLVETGAGRIFVMEAGEGPAVLFVHGTAAWSGLWRPTLEAVAARGYRAIAFDLPPFGFSERATDGDYARRSQAARILALVQALEVRPVLVAHSFGAAPGVEAVMAEPAAFAGLVVVDGAVGLDAPARGLPALLQPMWLREAALSLTATNPLLTRQLLASLLHVKAAATPDIAELLQRPMVRRGSTRAFAEWLPSLLVPDPDARSARPEGWAALPAGAELIWGDRDSVTPLAQGEALAALAPEAHLQVLEGVGHIPQIEAPEPFRAALLAALDRIVAR
ncbi:alpha/beta fold hydrolase [Seohaeicola zhoushanensis]|uniref:Alpha/beta hydrolase n=1 Tax=Seohaeicola zhoushanensis TaxID=1569283 RepID=A0A8J3GTE1_9RHOB|nr:alpha/beta hydrolase [Seohaeicola zhoushanensis]GHF34706.1 alpha/beta hydrolase [Seohaeicola zhoushanensis]